MWSRKYGDKCLDCGTTERKHRTKGLCVTCYERWLYHHSSKRREQHKVATYKWMKNNPEKWKEINQKAQKKYREKLSTE